MVVPYARMSVVQLVPLQTSGLWTLSTPTPGLPTIRMDPLFPLGPVEVVVPAFLLRKVCSVLTLLPFRCLLPTVVCRRVWQESSCLGATMTRLRPPGLGRSLLVLTPLGVLVRVFTGSPGVTEGLSMLILDRSENLWDMFLTDVGFSMILTLLRLWCMAFSMFPTLPSLLDPIVLGSASASSRCARYATMSAMPLSLFIVVRTPSVILWHLTASLSSEVTCSRSAD